MIDEILKVELNGLKQKIHIKGNNGNNPILLFLHGGPGMTNRHTALSTNEDLMDDFTLVAWDQRGTCGSYKGCKVETLTVDQLVLDAKCLVEYLSKRFNQEKIFIIGGSWGSELGTYLLNRYPEHIKAFVGFGQVVNGHLNELISWQFCVDEAKKANDQKSLDILNRIGPPEMGVYKNGYKGMREQRDIMMKYGGYSKNENKRSYWDAFVKPILKSKEYSFSDLVGYVKGYKFVLKKMWPEVGATDFKKTCVKFDAPIFIFDGRLDKNTPSELVQEWFDMIEAPKKELIWFENSGHNPMFDEGEKFKKLLKEKLLNL